MKKINPFQGLGTLVNHAAEGDNPLNAHVTPIFQTSTFGFPDVATGAAIFDGESQGYYYTRCGNPNQDQVARKVAYLEGLDLMRSNPEADPDSLVAGQAFASGMAAITTGILSRVKAGQTLVAQKALYSNVFSFLTNLAPRVGIHVVWVENASEAAWEAAFDSAPQAALVYAETPTNPTLNVVDLALAAEVAHRHSCWLMVDNTFATPYCQRPLTFGADLVAHSTTKYLSGHGTVIGGVLVSPHVDFMRKELNYAFRMYGGSPSPFDAWLTDMGLKTFELRMQRHCENALAVARYLEGHPKVETVYYPGLPGSPEYQTACQQMHAFGGMVSFELKEGLAAGEALMNRVKVASLAVSLGMVDSLIQHPASMTHHITPREERLKQGITDGLVRFSVGIENIEDILSDLEQGLRE